MMDGKKVKDVNKVRKDECAENLDENIERLVMRMKRQVYQRQPTRRVYKTSRVKGKEAIRNLLL